MPKDYSLAVTPANEQRRPENARDDDWTRAFLVRARVGRVATRWDDQPFITPTTFWYDPQRREIYFHSNLVGRVRANGERHARVCFEASEFGRLLPSNVALEFSLQYASVLACCLRWGKRGCPGRRGERTLGRPLTPSTPELITNPIISLVASHKFQLVGGGPE